MDYVVQTVVAEAAKAAAHTDQDQWLIFGFLTPVNTILVSIILFMISGWIFAPDFPSPNHPPPARLFRFFTPKTLLPNNGTDGKPIYLAVRGRVFDVSSRPQFYGPGSSYANFAGRDASRGLACGSFDVDMLTEDLDGPLDKLEGLTPEQLEALEGWEESFRSKYVIIGKLMSQEDYDKLQTK